jgi:hypothetical protein
LAGIKLGKISRKSNENRPLWKDQLRAHLTHLEIKDELLSFPAGNKVGDPRFIWFSDNFGDQCWELDARIPAISAPSSRNQSTDRSRGVGYDRAAKNIYNRGGSDSRIYTHEMIERR